MDDKQCPLDKDELGRSTWGMLHTMAAHYPDKPTDRQKVEIKQFFNILSRFYPCEYCSKDMQAEFKKDPPVADSQEKLSQWLCQFHNKVNLKLGKPQFDCSKVNERWRDGWLDGSCD
jgi:FAD-linked sulfhydryl oxidase